LELAAAAAALLSESLTLFPDRHYQLSLLDLAALV
jgi:hypothetical protein